MTLTGSIVADAALGWFGKPGYAVGHGPKLVPGEPAAEPACALHADRRDSFGAVLVELARSQRAAGPGYSRGGAGNSQEILVSSKHVERRLNS